MITGNSYDIATGEWRSDANSLLTVQEFWFAMFMTILYAHYPFPSPRCTTESSYFVTSVLIPWVTLREVPVQVEIVCTPSPGRWLRTCN